MTEPHSKFLCPSCNRPLRSGVEIRQGGHSEHVVWCGVGPCQPSKLGNGATGKTEKEAYEKLVKMFEE